MAAVHPAADGCATQDAVSKRGKPPSGPERDHGGEGGGRSKLAASLSYRVATRRKSFRGQIAASTAHWTDAPRVAQLGTRSTRRRCND